MRELDTVRVEVEEGSHIATLRLDRPLAGNAIDRVMCSEFLRIWSWVREDDDIRVVVLRAEGDDFCAGIDRSDLDDRHIDPGEWLGPKRNRVWKPVICAVHGEVESGAFHWINGADVIIAADDATFVDGDLSRGTMSAVVPVGLAERLPIGEVMRLVLMGLDEAMSADRAHQLGLVSEILPRESLAARAHELAASMASKSPTAVQGTVRAIWESQQMPPWIAQSIGGHYVNLGNDRSMLEVDPKLFESGYRPAWELR
jgi:enoyl-CoA hydratase/carnithine racemase